MFSAVIKILTITACVLFWPPPAMAERMPTDTELRAAYCMTALASLLEQQNQTRDRLLLRRKDSNVPAPDPALEKKIQELEKQIQNLLIELPDKQDADKDTLRRFHLYLLPRLSEIELTSVLIAMERGEEDANRLIPDAKGCTQSCQVPASRYDSCTEACFKNRGLYKLNERFSSCREPTWLPF